MSFERLNLYHTDGRIRGAYVYMMVCQDGGPIHIKVGMTSSPTTRLHALRKVSGVKPWVFAIVEVFSRDAAYHLERQLHKELAPWRSDGEWFRFHEDDKEQFNRAWKTVFAQCAKPGWPLSWTKIPVEPVVRDANRRKYLARHRWRQMGEFKRRMLKETQREGVAFVTGFA